MKIHISKNSLISLKDYNFAVSFPVFPNEVGVVVTVDDNSRRMQSSTVSDIRSTQDRLNELGLKSTQNHTPIYQYTGYKTSPGEEQLLVLLNIKTTRIYS